MLLERLCNESGVSGDCGRIRDIIIEEIKPYTDKIIVDVMGNLIAYKKGKSAEKTIMLAAHMDEVGLIVSEITSDGYLKFQTVGGIDARVLVGKSVLVGDEKIVGVIAKKAVHLQTKSEREAAVKEDSLYIDIGASDKDDAAKFVSLGDYCAFDTKFAEFGEGFCKAKALDDRAGCCILAGLTKCKCEYDTYFCFTVQEEVGCRGAMICANRIKPDAAMVIEGTTCSYVSGAPEHLSVTTPHMGAAISVMDKGSYSDIELTKKLYNLCLESGIKVQYKRTTMGGNDARSIQTAVGGTRVCTLSVPCKYIHSPVSVMSVYDFEAAESAAKLFVERTKELI